MAEEPGAAANERLSRAVQRAHDSWQQLGMRARAMTPSGIVHFALIAGAVGVITWLIRVTWPALLPFIIGAVIAYAVVPIVEALEHVMPRVLAAFLTMVSVMVFIFLFLALIVPPIVRELYLVFRSLPSADDVDRYGTQLGQYINTLPEPVRNFINAEIGTVTTHLRANIQAYFGKLLGITASAILGVLQAVGVILGFFVIPTWLLIVLRDRRMMRRFVGRVVPAWMAPDFWAVSRILDRTLSAFVRGQLVLGLIVGALTWGTLFAFDYRRTGSIEYGRYAVIMGMIAGILQLIPTIGPIANLIIGVLIGLTISRKVAALVLVIYVAIQFVVGRFIAPRFGKRVVDLHPGTLVMCIVALSQFGFVWALVAAPLVSITRDLFRYAYGRLGDPPRPAGLLPGDKPVLPRNAARISPAAEGAERPLVYRRRRATRQP